MGRPKGGPIFGHRATTPQLMYSGVGLLSKEEESRRP